MNSWLPLMGRVLLVVIYLWSGFHKIADPAGTMGYMAAAGMPATKLFLVLAILAELGGGTSVVLGYKTRWGAAALVLFLIPATLIFHRDFGNPIQMIMFLKNVSMLGGLLVLLANGPGRWSLDARNAQRPGRSGASLPAQAAF
jgi:putative oxidoreductase